MAAYGLQVVAKILGQRAGNVATEQPNAVAWLRQPIDHSIKIFRKQVLRGLLQQLLDVVGEIVHKALLVCRGIGVAPQQRRLQLGIEFQAQGFLKAGIAVKPQFVDQTQHRWATDGGFFRPLGDGFQAHDRVLV